MAAKRRQRLKKKEATLSYSKRKLLILLNPTGCMVPVILRDDRRSMEFSIVMRFMEDEQMPTGKQTD